MIYLQVSGGVSAVHRHPPPQFLDRATLLPSPAGRSRPGGAVVGSAGGGM